MELLLPKIILTGHIVVPDQDLPKVRSELPRHIELTLQEEGCLVFEVTQCESDERIFTVYEKFVNRSAFEAHQERVKTSRWGEVTSNVERHYTISGTGNS